MNIVIKGWAVLTVAAILLPVALVVEKIVKLIERWDDRAQPGDLGD